MNKSSKTFIGEFCEVPVNQLRGLPLLVHCTVYASEMA